MANEITVSANITSDRGACSFVREYSTSVDQTTADMYAEVITINGDAALSFGLGANGWIWAQNISENGASVDMGPEVSGAILPVVTLFPQHMTCFRLDPDITVRVNATFGTLYYVVVNR